jgi:hypothetical protein
MKNMAETRMELYWDRITADYGHSNVYCCLALASAWKHKNQCKKTKNILFVI